MAVEHYRPASSAFYTIPEGSSARSIKIPNVAGLYRQFEFLPELWNSCIDDLSRYSRSMSSKKGGNIAAWLAWQALPEELKATQSHPLRAEFDAIMASGLQEEGLCIVQVEALAALIGLTAKAKLTHSDSVKVAPTGLPQHVESSSHHSMKCGELL